MDKHIRTAGLAGAALLLLGSTGVQAEVTPGFVITPGVRYDWFEDDGKEENQAGVDDDFGFRLGLGYQFDPRWLAELTVGYTEPELSENDDYDLEMLEGTLDVYFNLMPEWTVTPYLVGFAGWSTYEVDDALVEFDEEEAIAGYGGGLRAQLSERLFARADVRSVTYLENEIDNIQAQAVVGFTFPTERAPEDSDGDGVPDAQDRCADTPMGVSVGPDGCPQDSDGDGVPDYLDNCPDSASGAKVDDQGCYIVLEKPVSIRMEVLFDFDESEVKPQFFGEIEKTAQFMQEYPETRAVIEGHTDSIGSTSYNQALSQRRAEAVRQVLVQRFNVDSSRLKAVGYGEQRPVASNDNDAGRRQNRRVVAVISATKEERVRQ